MKLSRQDEASYFGDGSAEAGGAVESLKLHGTNEVAGASRFRLARLLRPIDLVVAFYTALTALIVLLRYPYVSDAGDILAFHVVVLLIMALLPPRGAAWESSADGEASWKRTIRGAARFLRYTYPLLLVLFFFEEVEAMVHSISPATPYWFEPHLYAADRWLFGELPALLMSGWGHPLLDELMHAFYFSYYIILIGGVVIAYAGAGARQHPAPGFEMAVTSMVCAFLLAFVWYPFLPARGPWENPELMAGLRPFEGFVFVPTIERIIAAGAQSGGCFPSSHVAGSWGMVWGLALAGRRRPAIFFGLAAVGLSVSCVYTRYHHGVDVPAGFAAGALGAFIAYRLTRSATLRPERSAA